MPAIGCILSSTRTQSMPVTTPFSPTKARGHHREIALGAFLVARRRAQLQRPVRPVQHLVFLLGRHRHDFELRHLERALADRGADAVRSGVAAADHDDMLAGREDRLVGPDRLAGDAPVLLRQEIHREMDAGEVAARNGQVARRLGAAGERDGVVGIDERAALTSRADMRCSGT